MYSGHFSCKFNENNIFFPQSLHNFNVVTASKWSICYTNYPLTFYKVQISTNYKEIILKLFVPSVSSVRTGTSLPVIREITPVRIIYWFHSYQYPISKCRFKSG